VPEWNLPIRYDIIWAFKFEQDSNPFKYGWVPAGQSGQIKIIHRRNRKVWDLIWPIGLVVLSNVMYQICAKSVPGDLNPFASLTITYLIGAISSGILYFILSKDVNLIKEYSKVNWASFVLGFVIVGLEVGFIYAYKAGWQVSTASIVQSAFLASVLIFVGALLYNEALSWNKLVGTVVCLAGLGLINMK